jgi:hypothetical protein
MLLVELVELVYMVRFLDAPTDVMEPKLRNSTQSGSIASATLACDWPALRELSAWASMEAWQSAAHGSFPAFSRAIDPNRVRLLQPETFTRAGQLRLSHLLRVSGVLRLARLALSAGRPTI